MKFLKIGVSSSGGTITPYNVSSETHSRYLNFITSCTGKIVKWDDPIEENAVNLIVTWQLSLKHDDGMQVWDKTHNQHYRIHDKKNPPIDSDLVNLIKESYSDFELYLEKEKEESNLYNLDSDLIQKTLLELREVCNSSPLL